MAWLCATSPPGEVQFPYLLIDPWCYLGILAFAQIFDTLEHIIICLVYGAYLGIFRDPDLVIQRYKRQSFIGSYHARQFEYYGNIYPNGKRRIK